MLVLPVIAPRLPSSRQSIRLPPRSLSMSDLGKGSRSGVSGELGFHPGCQPPPTLLSRSLSLSLSRVRGLGYGFWVLGEMSEGDGRGEGVELMGSLSKKK